jgi:SAM-dependent methyltransferase
MKFQLSQFLSYLNINVTNSQWNGKAIRLSDNLIDVLPQNTKNSGTSKAASFRWAHSQRLESDEAFVNHQLNDFLGRYNFKTKENFGDFLKNKKVFLEIGAGEGRLVDWVLKHSSCLVIAVEISDVVHYLSQKYQNEPRVLIIRGDAIDLPINYQVIDVLSCEQSIHLNTSYPGEIFSNLCQYLKVGGNVLLSVYAQKSPQRERFDRVIRDSIAKLSAEHKFKIADGMTKIGQLLYEMDVEIEVPNDPEAFGNISGQKTNLQRFIYYTVMKCFWNPNFSFDKCKEFNHDWYSYPKHHTVSFEEAAGWFKDNDLSIEYFDINPSNVNLRGRKK